MSQATETNSTLDGMLVRRVKVDRTLHPMDAISVPSFMLDLDEDVVKHMPHGEGEEVGVWFINFSSYMTVTELEQEVDRLGFRLADPYSLVSAVKEDPTLAVIWPLATQWHDKDGQACCAIFSRWRNGNGVFGGQRDDAWFGDMWFACLRK